MNDDEPIYPSSQARITANFADFDKPSMGPTDVLHVRVSITDPAGTILVNNADMAWSADEALWFFKWTTPADSANKMFQYVAVLTALDNGTQPVYGQLWVDPSPFAPTGPVLPQPQGLPPLSTHFVQTWCDESDLPASRLEDSNGKRIADVNLGWMVGAAQDLLYVLSGRKFRAGRSVIRPTALAGAAMRVPAVYPYSSIGAWGGYGSVWGFPAGWAWSSLGLGWSGGVDGRELILQGPVRRINYVKVDGQILDPNTDYMLYNRRRLVRATGGMWPWNQDPGTDASQLGTMEIDYEWGRNAKESGRLACAELAIELALGFSGQDACRLPGRVMSVASEGVTVSVKGALDFLKEDLTGLPICDLFLRAENPAKKRRPSAFLSPSTVLNRSR